jgi:hypothetical protein
MNLLSLDPGTTQTAWIQWDGQRIVRMGMTSNEGVISICRLHDSTRNTTLAIEQIACYGMPVGAEVFETAVWSGRFIQACEHSRIMRIPRKEICLHLCGSPRAKDGNIRQALIDRLGPQGTKKHPGATYGVSKHLWAALAVALTASDRLRGEVVAVETPARYPASVEVN